MTASQQSLDKGAIQDTAESIHRSIHSSLFSSSILSELGTSVDLHKWEGDYWQHLRKMDLGSSERLSVGDLVNTRERLL